MLKIWDNNLRLCFHNLRIGVYKVFPFNFRICLCYFCDFIDTHLFSIIIFSRIMLLLVCLVQLWIELILAKLILIELILTELILRELIYVWIQ